MDCCETYGTWRKAYSDPKKFFSKLKPRPGLSTALKWAVLAGVISTFLAQLVLVVYGNTDAVSALVATLIGGVIAVPLVLLICSGVLLVFARLLGGKAGYDAQTYAMAAVQAPLSIALAIVAFVVDLLFAPASFAYGAPVRAGVVGAVYGVVSLAAAIYALYVTVIALRTIHKFSTMRAIATLLVPAVLLCLLAAIAIGYLIAMGLLPLTSA
jgi:hypothetical protein